MKMAEIIHRNGFECLYLLKEGTNEVFVNNCQLLKQHQINGLRFLFMLFKKNKPGAIVSFPHRCGKSITVAIFLYAVRNLLEKPVLIICKNENEIYLWKEYLMKWTEFNNDDIIIESTKIKKGKKIFIKNINSLALYQQHSWSVVVVKDDAMSKEISGIVDARYKIWITSVDMKKDLPMMAFIYNWLYPKLKINLKDFIPSGNNHREVYLKSIYLDTFLEDFVVREEDIKQFIVTKHSLTSELITNQTNENKSKSTRKNKDDTGTKIKRSRGVPDDIMTIQNENENTATGSHKNKNIVYGNEYNEFKANSNNDNVIEANKSNTIELNKKDMEMDFTEEITFSNAIDEIVKNENNRQIENSTDDIQQIVIELNHENIDKNKDMEQGIDNSVHITQSIENVIEEITENEETTKDGDMTRLNDSVKGHKDVDTKLSELEERTLKKFKGSLLDSIF